MGARMLRPVVSSWIRRSGMSINVVCVRLINVNPRDERGYTYFDNGELDDASVEGWRQPVGFCGD